jgi:hypothetical protein
MLSKKNIIYLPQSCLSWMLERFLACEIFISKRGSWDHSLFAVTGLDVSDTNLCRAYRSPLRFGRMRFSRKRKVK